MGDNFKIYFEYEVKNFWFIKDNLVYYLSNREINEIIKFFINDQKTSKINNFDDYFNFKDFEFDESNLILDLNKDEDFKKFEDALNGESNEDGFVIKDPYIKYITEYEAENYIKSLIFEMLLEQNEEFYNILDKNFLVDLIDTYKNSLNLY